MSYSNGLRAAGAALLVSSTLALGGAGCGGSTADPCDGHEANTVCVTARVQGNATGLDQLSITADEPTSKTVTSPASPAAFNLPVKLALTFPSGTSGALHITVNGISGGSVVASNTQTVTLTGSHANATFTLDRGSAPDMAPVDLQPAPITVQIEQTSDGGVTSPAPTVTGYELEPITFSIVGTDPSGKTVSVAATGVPQTTVTSGTSPVSVTIKTDDTGAGSYNAMATASTSDGRTATENFVVNILNSIDPVYPLADSSGNGSLFLGGSIVGDFDNDGFADLASCSVAAGGSGSYTVKVLYGAASGLPTTEPSSGNARVQTYTFSGLNGTTTTSQSRLSCKGKDFDGDGFSDVVILDQNAAASGKGNGQLYVLFGQARTITAPSVVALLDAPTLPSGARLDDNGFAIGDYTGTGRNAVAFFATGNKTIYIEYLKAAGFTHPTGSPVSLQTTGLVTFTSTAYSEGSCGDPVIRGFRAIDGGSSANDLVVADPGTTCVAGGGPGNLDVYRSGASPSPVVIAGPIGSPNPFVTNLEDACDVDGDGVSDVVMGDINSGKVYVWFGAKGDYVTAANQLKLANAVTITTPTGATYDAMECAATFFGSGGHTLLLADTTAATPHVDVISTSRTPSFVRQLPNPGNTTFASSSGLSIDAQNIFGGFGDVNGDGQNDTVIGVSTADAGPDWLIYGR